MKPKITIVCIACDHIRESLLALSYTTHCLPVKADRVFVSHVQPPHGFDGRWIQLPAPFKNKDEYNRFVIERLADLVPEGFALVVQWDGYARNPSMWTDRFLDYDYIGAPFPLSTITSPFRFLVGNGGFSLRSHKWLQTTKSIKHLFNGMDEDRWMTIKMREKYIASGCEIAPQKIAARFSMEKRTLRFPFWNWKNSFGFHGSWNLPVETDYGVD
jgi:hypothetical protein